MGKYVSDTTVPGEESIQSWGLHFFICKLNLEVGEIQLLNGFLHHSPKVIRVIKNI